eukprot:scaffold938_cov334-Pavlova_lutheri.AAC.47
MGPRSPNPVTPWTLLEGSTCSPVVDPHIPQRNAVLRPSFLENVSGSPLRQSSASTLPVAAAEFSPFFHFPSRIPGATTGV